MSVVDELGALLLSYPYVLMATVALGLMVAVGVASVKAARRRLSYETWYGIHLYAYIAVALAFLHELAVGTDFVDDTVAQAYWVALYVAVIVLVVVFRIGQPIALTLRHRFRVAEVRRESPNAVSIYITGRHLERLAVRAGQFFYWRFLTGGGWWRAHPFSLSAAPNGKYLRITVKRSGDDTRLDPASQAPGTRVFAEGPYGAFTGLAPALRPGAADRRRHRHHAAARAARGVPRLPRRDHRHLPRQQLGERRLSRRDRRAGAGPRGADPLPRRRAAPAAAARHRSTRASIAAHGARRPAARRVRVRPATR